MFTHAPVSSKLLECDLVGLIWHFHQVLSWIGRYFSILINNSVINKGCRLLFENSNYSERLCSGSYLEGIIRTEFEVCPSHLN